MLSRFYANPNTLPEASPSAPFPAPLARPRAPTRLFHPTSRRATHGARLYACVSSRLAHHSSPRSHRPAMDARRRCTVPDPRPSSSFPTTTCIVCSTVSCALRISVCRENRRRPGRRRSARNWRRFGELSSVPRDAVMALAQPRLHGGLRLPRAPRRRKRHRAYDHIAACLEQREFRPRAFEQVQHRGDSTTDIHSTTCATTARSGVTAGAAGCWPAPSRTPSSIPPFLSIENLAELSMSKFETSRPTRRLLDLREAPRRISSGCASTDHGHPTARTADLPSDYARVRNGGASPPRRELFRAQMLTEMRGEHEPRGRPGDADPSWIRARP